MMLLILSNLDSYNYHDNQIQLQQLLENIRLHKNIYPYLDNNIVGSKEPYCCINLYTLMTQIPGNMGQEMISLLQNLSFFCIFESRRIVYIFSLVPLLFENVPE